jgi:hypothetical protein
MRRPHDIDLPSDAVARLARVGRAALPAVDAATVQAHLHAIKRARLAPARRITGRHRRRVLTFAVAGAMLVAVPSMAFAGVLPDPVQRAVSQAASAVGVHVPRPAVSHATHVRARHSGEAEATTEDRAVTGQSHRAAEAGDDHGARVDASHPGRGLGAATRGTRPGRLEAGEHRGNRFGQVAGGPDQGQAGESHGGGSGGGHGSDDSSSHGGGSTTHSAPTPPVAPTPSSPSPSSGGDDGASGGVDDSGSSSHGGGGGHGGA